MRPGVLPRVDSEGLWEWPSSTVHCKVTARGCTGSRRTKVGPTYSLTMSNSGERNFSVSPAAIGAFICEAATHRPDTERSREAQGGHRAAGRPQPPHLGPQRAAPARHSAALASLPVPGCSSGPAGSALLFQDLWGHPWGLLVHRSRGCRAGVLASVTGPLHRFSCRPRGSHDRLHHWAQQSLWAQAREKDSPM